MTILPSSLDYTDKDFDAIVARLQNLIPSVFPTWTDFNVANFGTIMLECFAFVGDVLSTYQDNQAGEAFLPTATQRKNLINLAKLLGYEPASANAATVEVSLSIPVAVSGDVPIPAGTRVKTAEIVDPVIFQTLDDTTITAGTTSTTVDAENSEGQEDTFTSDDSASQEFTLSSTPYLDGSLEVTAGDGVYTEVDNFLSSEATDRHFTVTVDQNDRATVRFGNGVNGKVPTGTITAEYKTGGGTIGNVEANKIRFVEGTFTDGFQTVTLSVDNALAASGGRDRESNEQIRTQAPQSIRVLGRAIAREDYEIAALEVAGVARALMTTKEEDAGVAENAGILYVIPEGGGYPTQTLKDQVAAQFAEDGPYPSHLTFTLITDNDPVYRTIDVYAVIYIDDGYAATTVASSVRSALTSYFAVSDADGSPNENVDFGFNLKDVNGDPANEIAFSDVYNAVRDVEGVRKIGDGITDFTLNTLHRDVDVEPREFPTLGTVSLIDGDTGQTI